ncbi:MAG: type II secretion system F family protein [Candidatus Pacebacteria bacterium]|nr:type II secretion system F family protein [Candidatus Paceibacterota bacterium]
MPYFFYKAKNLEGQTDSGVLQASDEHELAQTLKKQDKFLIWSEIENKKPKRKPSLASFFKKISILDKIIFTRNLEVMISAGVPIPKALDVLTVQAQSQKFKKIIQEIKADIVKGKSFSSALKKHTSVFPEIFSNMIVAGEESGSMTESLKVLTEQMEKEYELKSKIKGALIYPIVIISAMAGIGILMMIIVVPMIANTFEELEVELPIATKIVIALGMFISNYWYLFFGIIILSIFLIKAFLKTNKGKIIGDKILFKLPIISGLIQKANLAYICRTLSSLISSGVSLVKSLDLIFLSVNNVFYKKAIKQAQNDVQKGIKLADSLAKNNTIFSSLVVQMIQVGEETGETSSLLKKLAEFYEQETANITKNLSTLIEPILMLLIGVAIGFFAVSIIQPIYSMLGAI